MPIVAADGSQVSEKKGGRPNGDTRTDLDPWVSKELVDSVALLRINVEEVGNQVLGCEGEAIRSQLSAFETSETELRNVQEAEISSHHGERKV